MTMEAERAGKKVFQKKKKKNRLEKLGKIHNFKEKKLENLEFLN